MSQTSELLAERLQAWKHAVGYLEDYISVIEKAERAQAKEYEKVLKVCFLQGERHITCLTKIAEYFGSVEGGPSL